MKNSLVNLSLFLLPLAAAAAPVVAARLGAVADAVPRDLTFTPLSAARLEKAGASPAAAASLIDTPARVTLTTDQDGVLLSTAQYAEMTNALSTLLAFSARQWAMIHSNGTARAAFHGGLVRETVWTNAEGRIAKTETYCDGYEFTPPARPAPSAPRVDLSAPATNAAQRIAARRAALAARRAAAAATTNVVTLTARPEAR